MQFWLHTGKPWAVLRAYAALECLATVPALRDGVLPPTANYNEPDPECDLDMVPNHARYAEPEYALPIRSRSAA
jgi:3-oxoacyl-(acyl-carrier-protein) synthase